MGKNSGFMNPTDRMRREERRRELRKNKKQRQIVRTSMIKGKDPYQIIMGLERLDKMEYDYYNPPPLSAKVLSDKRRKLRETWDRVVRLYIKEDKDKFLELKRMESEYEMKRTEMVKKYEAIKSAQEVSLDAIPLPEAPSATTSAADNLAKKPSILKTPKGRYEKEPPGCPIGGPPSWSDYDLDEDEEYEEILEEDEVSPRKKIKFEDETDDKDNLSNFLKEIEQISGDKEKNNKPKEVVAEEVKKEFDEPVPSSSSSSTLPSTSQAASASTFYRNPIQPAPPIVSDLVGIPSRLPVPPPIFGGDGPPPQPPTLRPAHLMNRPMFAPNAAPPYHNLPGFPPQQQQQQYALQPRKPEKPKAATIEAAPQLRNLSADTTKFMPLALRVRREGKRDQLPAKKVKKPLGYGIIPHQQQQQPPPQSSHYSEAGKETKSNAKDDAYEEFIKEMTGLI